MQTRKKYVIDIHFSFLIQVSSTTFFIFFFPLVIDCGVGKATNMDLSSEVDRAKKWSENRLITSHIKSIPPKLRI